MLMREMVRAGKQNLPIYRPLPLKPGVQSQAQWLSARGKLIQEGQCGLLSKNLPQNKDRCGKQGDLGNLNR